MKDVDFAQQQIVVREVYQERLVSAFLLTDYKFVETARVQARSHSQH